MVYEWFCILYVINFEHKLCIKEVILCEKINNNEEIIKFNRKEKKIMYVMFVGFVAIRVVYMALYIKEVLHHGFEREKDNNQLDLNSILFYLYGSENYYRDILLQIWMIINYLI